MTFDFDTDSDDPFDGPNIADTTPGSVKLECPNCGLVGVIEKYRYHEIDDYVICGDCRAIVAL